MKKSKISKPNSQPKSPSYKPGSIAQGNLGASVFSMPMQAGMSDVRNHRLCWLVGYTYVGNGTLGATDSVYLADVTKTYTVVTVAASGSNVPIAPGDSVLGASYATDVIKHFSRMRVNDLKLAVVSLHPSTSNDMVAILAPQAGGVNIGGISASTNAAIAYSNVISMQGVASVPSWGSTIIELKSYIRGGSGAQQNEFSIDSYQYATATSGGPTTDYLGVIPATFAVSGNNTSTGLRGSFVHAVYACLTVDLIDYIGGDVTNVEPLGSPLHHRVSSSRIFRSRNHLGLTDLPKVVPMYLNPFELKFLERLRDLRKSTPPSDGDALRLVEKWSST